MTLCPVNLDTKNALVPDRILYPTIDFDEVISTKIKHLSYYDNSYASELEILLLQAKKANIFYLPKSLFICILKNNIKMLTIFLKYEIRTLDNSSLYKQCAKRNQNPMLELLLRHEYIEINHKIMEYVFVRAVETNALHLLELLIKRGMDFNHYFRDPRFGSRITPLLYAVRDSKIDIVHFLIKIEGININITDDNKRNACFYTIHVPVLDYLLSNGIDPNMKTYLGEHLVVYICKAGTDTNDVLIKYLLNHHSVEIDDDILSCIQDSKIEIVMKTAINRNKNIIKNKLGIQVMKRCIVSIILRENTVLSIIKFMLENGVDPSSTIDNNSVSPYWLAVSDFIIGYKILKLFMELAPEKLDHLAKNSIGLTPLDVVIKNRVINTIEILLAAEPRALENLVGNYDLEWAHSNVFNKYGLKSCHPKHRNGQLCVVCNVTFCKLCASRSKRCDNIACHCDNIVCYLCFMTSGNPGLRYSNQYMTYARHISLCNYCLDNSLVAKLRQEQSLGKQKMNIQTDCLIILTEQSGLD